MLTRLHMTVLPETAHAAPGGCCMLSLTIRNSGDRIEHALVRVRGVRADWYDLDRPSVLIGPHTQARVRLTLHPPLEATFTAVGYPLTIEAVDDDAIIMASVAAVLMVGDRSGLSLELSPVEVEGSHALFVAMVRNGSDTAAAVTLDVRPHGASPSVGPHVSMEPSGELLVPAHAARPVAVRIRSRLVGAPRTYDLDVRAASVGQEFTDDLALIRVARFTATPRYGAPVLLTATPRRPLWAALALLVVLLLARLLAVALPGSTGTSIPRAAPARQPTATVPVPPRPDAHSSTPSMGSSARNNQRRIQGPVRRLPITMGLPRRRDHGDATPRITIPIVQAGKPKQHGISRNEQDGPTVSPAAFLLPIGSVGISRHHLYKRAPAIMSRVAPAPPRHSGMVQPVNRPAAHAPPPFAAPQGQHPLHRLTAHRGTSTRTMSPPQLHGHLMAPRSARSAKGNHARHGARTTQPVRARRPVGNGMRPFRDGHGTHGSSKARHVVLIKPPLPKQPAHTRPIYPGDRHQASHASKSHASKTSVQHPLRRRGRATTQRHLVAHRHAVPAEPLARRSHQYRPHQPPTHHRLTRHAVPQRPRSHHHQAALHRHAVPTIPTRHPAVPLIPGRHQDHPQRGRSRTTVPARQKISQRYRHTSAGLRHTTPATLRLDVSWPLGATLRFEHPFALRLTTLPGARLTVTLRVLIVEAGVDGRRVAQVYRYSTHAQADHLGHVLVPLHYAYIPAATSEGDLTVVARTGTAVITRRASVRVIRS